MNASLKIIALISWIILAGSPISIGQTIDTKADLEDHLARAISMADLDKIYTTDLNEFNSEVQFLADINAKFIGRAWVMWGSQEEVAFDRIDDFKERLKALVDSIKNAYAARSLPPPIIQGTIFENIGIGIQFVDIPESIADTFGYDWNNGVQRFSRDSMFYFPGSPGGNVVEPGDTIAKYRYVPDISKKHTKMWFYQLARLYIEAGFTSIHFGDILRMDDNDPGHVHYWDLLSKIRNYADSLETIILCDAHTERGLYYDGGLAISVYDEVDGHGLSSPAELYNLNLGVFDQDPNETYPYYGIWWQSIMDFNTLGVFVDSLIGTDSTAEGNYRVGIRTNPSGPGLINKQISGTSPFKNLGWTYSNTPYLVEFDHASCIQNCGGNTYYPGESTCGVWGWDAITWFNQNTDIFKNEFLSYAYQTVQSEDSHGFFQVPGRRPTCKYPYEPDSLGKASNLIWYRAYPAQMDAIYCIWEEATAYDNWNPINTSGLMNVGGDIVVEIPTASNSNLFYRGTDGDVHMFTNTGSYWSDFDFGSIGFPDNVNTTSKLKFYSSGNLFYRGNDNRLHYYDHLGSWAYHNTWGPAKVKGDFDFGNGTQRKVFYHGTDDRMHMLTDKTTWWSDFTFSLGKDVKNTVIVDDESTIFYVNTDNKVQILKWTSCGWVSYEIGINNVADNLVVESPGSMYYRSSSNELFHLERTSISSCSSNWTSLKIDVAPDVAGDITVFDSDMVYYRSSADNKIHFVKKGSYIGTWFHGKFSDNSAKNNFVFGHNGKLFYEKTTENRIYYYSETQNDFCAIGGDVFRRKPTTPAHTNLSSPVNNLPSKNMESVQIGTIGQFYCYPNPTDSWIKVSFELPKESEITVDIWDQFGRKIIPIASTTFKQGKHEIDVDLAHLPSGIYICRLNSAEETMFQKILIE